MVYCSNCGCELTSGKADRMRVAKIIANEFEKAIIKDVKTQKRWDFYADEGDEFGDLSPKHIKSLVQLLIEDVDRHFQASITS